MTAKNETLAHLRAVLAPVCGAQKRVHLGVPRLDGVLGGGLKGGALHEVIACPGHETAATGFVAGLVTRFGGPVLWIAQDYGLLEHGALAATGLVELGLAPDRLVLVQVPDAACALKAAMEGLSCPALATVVIELVGEPKLLDLVAYRKLVLAAGESGVSVLLLRFSAQPNLGAAETRWQIRSLSSSGDDDWGAPVFEAVLQRNRAGAGGTWALLWSCDDGFFRPADCSAVVSAAADRPAFPALAKVFAA